MSTHETDFYTWTQEQAALLRQGRFIEADIDYIAEELESMGASAQGQLESRLGVLLAHLLKWRYQPERRSNSWIGTIREQRRRVARVLRKNPGLKPSLGESIEDAYGDAIGLAMRETNLDEDTFPPECPWSFEQIMNADFWPSDTH